MKNLKFDEKKILLILLVLIVLLFAHNIYLQTRVNKAIQYASSAVDNAAEAERYAREAAENAFGNVCDNCP